MATNPIINADVPDIAIIRVGNTYYMSSTTMHMNPGVPILKSSDLVNWELVTYCHTALSTSDAYNLNNGKNEYGHGSWASSIRYHKGMYYVTTFANTGRTYIYKTANIETGPWTVSTLNTSYHDCNLFFDDDDRAYLVYGQGDIKIIELTADASAIKAGGVNETLITNAGAIAGPIGLNAEGCQVLKYNGYYFINNICWPSGGMRTQIIHRSSTLTGTYESKVILREQGVAQGSFINTPNGKWYAYLFRDAGAVGRIPYLVPMTWTNNWPVLSVVPLTLDIPKGVGGMHNIVASDEFSQAPPLKLAWQWNHNPQNNYWSLTQKIGFLRLTNERTDPNVLMTTNTLTQRTFGPQCSAYTSIDLTGMKDGDYVGMIALQKQYGYVGVKMIGGTKSIVMVNGNDVTGTPNQVASIPLNQNVVYVRIDMDYRNRTDKAYFYYSLNGTTWQAIGATLQMSYTIPHFMGYRYGLFSYATTSTGGYADFDFFRIGTTINEASTVIDNAAVVSITAPTNTAVYTEGDNVTINATATIATGSISKVDFYNGTTLFGTDATAPYTYTINAAIAGNYVITAKATSASNAATTSTAVAIQVAKPIYQTGSVPAIDGTIDPLWSNFTSTSILKNNSGTVSSTADLSGNWKAMWNATNLYVLVQVTDDVKRNDAGTDVYNDDGVEVYIDMANTKGATYGTNDQQYTFRWNDVTAAYEINGHSVVGITKGITNTATGYIVEMSIPWATMGGTASVNALEGFEVMISDDDDGTARDGKLAWSATADDTWSNPSLMGTIILKGLNCTAPTASITTTTATTFCAGGSVSLNASTGTGYSYVWKNGATTITGATTASYTAAAAGTYTVTITNAGGCSATSAATAVTVNVLPTISQYAQVDGGTWNQVSTATVCAGSTVVLGPQPTVAAGWSWTGPNGYAATTREIILSGLTATQGGVYTASYTDGNTCKATSTFTLTVNAQPTAAITTTTPTTFCAGGNVVLTASAGTSYVWKNGATIITGATAQSYTAATAGSYTVEVMNANNCKATSTATTITVNSAPTASITTTTPTTFCAGGNVVLTASAGSSYVWKNGTTIITGATAQSYTAATAGSYTVEVMNAGNCKATSAAIIVTVNALPTATITANGHTSIPQGGSVVLTASAGSSYKWFNGTTQVGTAQNYTAAAAGAYRVEVTHTNNCKAISIATDVNISANQPSVIAITSPAPNATVTGGIDIAVSVTDADGSIVLVEFLDGDDVIGTSTTAPYAFTWDNPSEGSHTITVRVTDSNGGITTSAPRVVSSSTISTGVYSANTLNAVVYPNPSNDIVYIDTNEDLSNASFTLIDVFGRDVSVLSVTTGSGVRMDVSNLSEGAYVMIIKLDNSILRKKITIIK